MKSATQEDLRKLEASIADALAIMMGVLAEAVGTGKTAYQIGSALQAFHQRRPDPLRDQLLKDAYRLVLIKARNHHPDDPEIQALYTSELGEQKKH